MFFMDKLNIVEYICEYTHTAPGLVWSRKKDVMPVECIYNKV